MADRKGVAKQDGVLRTNAVQVEPGYFVAPDDELRLCEQQEVGSPGLLKVLELLPSEPRRSMIDHRGGCYADPCRRARRAP